MSQQTYIVQRLVALRHMLKPEWSRVKCCDTPGHTEAEANACMITILENRRLLKLPHADFRVIPQSEEDEDT